jgi:hypothetical protein
MQPHHQTPSKCLFGAIIALIFHEKIFFNFIIAIVKHHLLLVLYNNFFLKRKITKEGS